MFAGVNGSPCHDVLLMIINDLHVRRTRRAFLPFEANAPLVIDTNAELSPAVSLQSLKAVARQHSKIPKCDGSLKTIQLHAGRAFDARETLLPAFQQQSLWSAYRGNQGSQFK